MNNYNVLNKQIFKHENYSLVPIRFEDRFKIMQWRNQQMYHLRQDELITVEDQEEYFSKVVSNLFDQDKPNQILFSYLENDICIGYGGLVHINWSNKDAEISFLLNSDFEKKIFKTNWKVFLNLIESVAFKELKLYEIYTHAYDIRPKLFEVLEECGYEKKEVIKNSYNYNNSKVDTVIHSKIKNENIKK